MGDLSLACPSRLSGPAAALLLALCAALLSACGADPLADTPGSNQRAAEQPALVLESMPAPQDAAMPAARLVSGVSGTAENPLALSEFSTVEDDALRIAAGDGQMGWAVWGWYGFSESDYPTQASVDLAYVDGEYWLLFADFPNHRWSFSGPHSALSTSVDITQLTKRAIGNAGTFYVGVITNSSSSCAVSAINVTSAAASPQSAPLRWLSASVDLSANFVQLDWEAPLPDGHEVRRWDAGESESSAVPVPFDGDDAVLWDYDVAYGVNSYYRIYELRDGTAHPASPLALGRRAVPAEGACVGGRIEFDAYHGAPGEEVFIAELNLRTSSGPDGRFSFKGLPDGSYNLWCMRYDPPLHMGLLQLQGINLDVPTLQLPRQSVPAHNWYWLYPPQEVSATPTGSNSVRLDWSAAQYADRYRVYRSRFASLADLRLVAETSETSIELEGEPGGDNYYCLRSVEGELIDFRISEPGPAARFAAIPTGMLPDTIYALPEETQVQRGETVRVTVYAFQTMHGLRNLNMLRLSFENGNSYVPGSFNLGAPGNDTYELDGVWTEEVAPTGFLSTPDNFMHEFDLGSGRSAIDFNITPLKAAGQLEHATGALFNFELCINTDTNLSFIREDEILRTFYSGESGSTHNWSNDLNAGQPGIEIVD